MGCERCQAKDAAVRLLDVKWSGGERAVQAQGGRLDARLAAGIGLPHAQGFTAVVQMLSKGLLPTVAGAQAKPGGSGEDRACPHCGWTLRDLRQTSRFGCPRDYEVFGAVTEDLLERVQGTSKHCDLKDESQLERLDGEMKAAVAREDYETAARLRDQLRRMEASLEAEDALD